MAHQAEAVQYEKQWFIKNYKCINFVDDTKGLKCDRCERVLIYNYKMECGHIYCLNCKNLLIIGKEWICHVCKAFITHFKEEVEIERQVFHLKVHCLNSIYGCPKEILLKNLLTHWKKCKDTKEANLPAMYKGTNTLHEVVKRIGEMSVELKNIQQNYKALEDEKQQDIHDLQQCMQKLQTEIRGLISEFSSYKDATTRKLEQFEKDLLHLSAMQKGPQHPLQEVIKTYLFDVIVLSTPSPPPNYMEPSQNS